MDLLRTSAPQRSQAVVAKALHPWKRAGFQLLREALQEVQVFRLADPPGEVAGDNAQRLLHEIRPQVHGLPAHQQGKGFMGREPYRNPQPGRGAEPRSYPQKLRLWKVEHLRLAGRADDRVLLLDLVRRGFPGRDALGITPAQGGLVGPMPLGI